MQSRAAGETLLCILQRAAVFSPRVHNETQRALIAPQPDTLISTGNPRVHECHLIKASRGVHRTIPPYGKVVRGVTLNAHEFYKALYMSRQWLWDAGSQSTRHSIVNREEHSKFCQST